VVIIITPFKIFTFIVCLKYRFIHGNGSSYRQELSAFAVNTRTLINLQLKIGTSIPMVSIMILEYTPEGYEGGG